MSRYAIVCISITSICFVGLRPIDFLEELLTKYKDYQINNPQHRILLIFNQPYFAPGDTAFFKADYCYEDFEPIPGNHIITLVLQDEEGQIHQKIKFRINNGKAFNQVVIPEKLKAGYYRFVAYSDWMQKLPQACWFQRSVKIVGGKEIKRVDTSPIAKTVNFYFEGGKLVSGIPTKVIIKGQEDSFISVYGGEQIINRTQINSSGYGQFTLTPNLNTIYKAKVDGSTTEWLLKSVEKDGVSLELLDSAGGEFNISIPSTSMYFKEEIFAIAMSNGKITYQSRINFSGSQSYRLIIPQGSLTEYYNQLYLFDRNGNVLAERIFLPQEMKSVQAAIKLPELVKQNEQVSLQLQLKDNNNQPIVGNFTISILQDNLFLDYPVWNFLRLSDLPEVIEKLQSKEGADFMGLNDMLITQKWEKINWTEVLNNQSFQEKPKNFNSLRLQGQVHSKTTGLPAPDRTLVLIYFQKNTMGYEAYTKKGRFEIPYINDFWNDDLLFIGVQKGNEILDNEYVVSIDKDSIVRYKSWVSVETPQQSNYGTYAINRKVIEKSYSFFNQEQLPPVQAIEFSDDIENELSGSDHMVNLNDYVVFPTMKDLIKEVIPFVKCRVKASRNTVQVMFRSTNNTIVYEDNPLYVIDGIITRDTDYFLSLNPSDLLTIKTVNNPNKLVRLGTLGNNGVLIINSKKGNLGKLLIDENHLIQGLSKPITRHYSATMANDTRIPTTRSTIFWAPMVATNPVGEWSSSFVTTDDMGPMILTIQGISAQNKPIFFQEKFEVVYKSEK